jgi:hypothetical protein
MKMPEKINSILLVCLFMTLITGISPDPAGGQQREPMHPRNELLIRLGMMPDGPLHPSVPRVTASQALLMYQNGQARIAWVGEDGRKVVGAYHVRGTTVYDVEYYNKNIRLSKGQALLLYCA